jgi:hypothetical protein
VTGTPQRRAGGVPKADWSDENIERVKRLWVAGYSAGSISRQLGGAFTRNAVIGKLFRMGEMGRRQAAEPRNVVEAPKAPKLRAPIVKRLPGLNGGIRLSPAIMKPKALPDFKPLLHEVVTEPKPWLERKFGECAYPVAGDGAGLMSCCGPVWEARAYCRAHAEVMFRKPRTEAQRLADEARARKARSGKKARAA